MNIKSNDIIFLIGAGCSVEAGIPASGRMIDEIETLLRKESEWTEYGHLYNHLKSAIHYSAGLKGQFNHDVAYNIETLVNTLHELERNEDHPLYPFIATWNSRFVALAGRGFEAVSEFRRLILRQLKTWVLLEDLDQASYYSGFIKLQRDLNFPLRMFSLNYDLCVEYLETSDFKVETGFPGIGPAKFWDYERFDSTLAEHTSPNVYLYKLHGSINWRRDEKRNLLRLPHTEKTKPEAMEIIFGRDFKLDAADPYLFYAYEFRRCTLESKLIVCIGYGFGDSHINKMLSQSLSEDANRKLMVVAACKDPQKQAQMVQLVADRLSLKVPDEQVDVWIGTAKDFLSHDDLSTVVCKKLPEIPNAPF